MPKPHALHPSYAKDMHFYSLRYWLGYLCEWEFQGQGFLGRQTFPNPPLKPHQIQSHVSLLHNPQTGQCPHYEAKYSQSNTPFSHVHVQRLYPLLYHL